MLKVGVDIKFTIPKSKIHRRIISAWKKTYHSFIHDVKVNCIISSADSTFRAGDIVVITDTKPETISDFRWFKYRTMSYGYITYIPPSSNILKIRFSFELEINDLLTNPLYLVSVMNVTTNQRIWNTLYSFVRADQILNEVLDTNLVVQGTFHMCPFEAYSTRADDLRLASELNQSQLDAVVTSISKMKCTHKSFVELIWGPRGTGKTRTVSILLWNLLRLDYRILACAPTNVAITEVASRVSKILRDSSEKGLYSLGELLLFGNMDSKAFEMEEIFLDYRVKKLVDCFGEESEGWKPSFKSMIDFLENCISLYNGLVEKKPFLEFIKERFRATATLVKKCICILCTHVPKSFITEHNFKNMLSLVDLIDLLERKLFQENKSYEELMEIFSEHSALADETGPVYLKNRCILELRALQVSLDELNFPNANKKNRGLVENFCFRTASLIFCTASNSYKLRFVKMNPIELLVIDEAAQLKESEAIIPLSLSKIKHVILIGDECQLPAMVNSKVCDEANFGRSMFERLSNSGHIKHLLNTQYRMHSSISLFPNKFFYHNRIIDARSVQTESYKRNYLAGPMFGPISFINISGGREITDARRSKKNMVEAAVVLRIIQLLFTAHTAMSPNRKTCIMVTSPYSAQVEAIQKSLRHKYENDESFMVKVRSIEGCQGGEEDIVIVSTVKSNQSSLLGFTSSPNRINVTLTRARHCCWILGNERTLTNSGSIWRDLVNDAKVRQYFFDANDDKELRKVIINASKSMHLPKVIAPKTVNRKQTETSCSSTTLNFERPRYRVGRTRGRYDSPSVDCSSIVNADLVLRHRPRFVEESELCNIPRKKRRGSSGLRSVISRDYHPANECNYRGPRRDTADKEHFVSNPLRGRSTSPVNYSCLHHYIERSHRAKYFHEIQPRIGGRIKTLQRVSDQPMIDRLGNGKSHDQESDKRGYEISVVKERKMRSIVITKSANENAVAG